MERGISCGTVPFHPSCMRMNSLSFFQGCVTAATGLAACFCMVGCLAWAASLGQLADRFWKRCQVATRWIVLACGFS